MRNEKEIPDFVKVNGLGSLTLKSSNMAAVSIRKRNAVIRFQFAFFFLISLSSMAPCLFNTRRPLVIYSYFLLRVPRFIHIQASIWRPLGVRSVAIFDTGPLARPISLAWRHRLICIIRPISSTGTWKRWCTFQCSWFLIFVAFPTGTMNP